MAAETFLHGVEFVSVSDTYSTATSSGDSALAYQRLLQSVFLVANSVDELTNQILPGLAP